MRPISKGCVAALGVLLVSATTHAADEVYVYVYEYTGSPCFGSASVQPLKFDAGQAFTIESNSCVEQINITTLGSNHAIGHVTINGQSRNPLEIIIGSGAFPSGTGKLPSAAVNWAGLTISNSGVRAATRLAGTISGDLTGSVNVGAVHRFDVEGNLAAPFFVSDDSYHQLIIEAGTITSSGGVIASSANITRVNAQDAIHGEIRADNGDIDLVRIINQQPLLGDVKARNGAIGDIVIGSSLFQVGGDIGSSTETVTIEARDGIDLIDGGIIWADITTNFNSGAGDIVRCGAWGGAINGSLTARRLGRDRLMGEYLNIGGDINSDIIATDPLTTPIYVRGGLGSNGSITLPAGGLQHQIFFNTLDEGPQPWDGTITVGSDVLDSQTYDALPSVLGGGAAGLINYGIHDDACDPINGTVMGGNGSGSLSIPPDEIILEHYGPIEIADPLVDPLLDAVTVERRGYPILLWGGGAWTDVTSQYTVVEIDEAPGATGDVMWGRRLKITPADNDPFDKGYQYRIRPTSNLTTDTLGNVGNAELSDYTYLISILNEMDLNMNGSVDAPDITVWAADPIDLNGDQSADSQDLADLLEEVGQGN